VTLTSFFAELSQQAETHYFIFFVLIIYSEVNINRYYKKNSRS